MDKELIIHQTAEYAKKILLGESTGHDWYHIYRVWKSAKQISHIEKADSFVVEIAALLHDIADHKLNNGDYNLSINVSKEWLESNNVESKYIKLILDCIRECSFSSGHISSSLESKIVQDADRLDAIGAIGIARAFATGSYLQRTFF